MTYSITRSGCQEARFTCLSYCAVITIGGVIYIRSHRVGRGRRYHGARQRFGCVFAWNGEVGDPDTKTIETFGESRIFLCQR